jgi:hypothetical protein
VASAGERSQCSSASRRRPVRNLKCTGGLQPRAESKVNSTAPGVAGTRGRRDPRERATGVTNKRAAASWPGIGKASAPAAISLNWRARGAGLALDAADELDFVLRLDPPAADGIRFAHGELTQRGADDRLCVFIERVGLRQAPCFESVPHIRLNVRRASRLRMWLAGPRCRPRIMFEGDFNSIFC